MQVQTLEDRANLMITVGASAQYLEPRIDLAEGRNCDSQRVQVKQVSGFRPPDPKESPVRDSAQLPGVG